jgi:hypothetical protein
MTKVLIKESRLFDLVYKFITDRVGEFKLNYVHPDLGYHQWNDESDDFFADYNDNNEYGINENLYEAVVLFFGGTGLDIDRVWKKWLEDNLKLPASDIYPVGVGDFL